MRAVVMREQKLLLPVPNGLDSGHAALTEPMAVGLHAVEMARLQKDDLPIVIGCGPVGLAVITALRLRGAAPIIAADFSPKRRALAEQMGAEVVVDPAAQSPYERFGELAAVSGVDPASPAALMGIGPQARPGVVFECVGVPGVLQQIFEGAARGTRIVVAGVCMERDQVEPIFGINKELSLQFVLAYTPEEFTRTLHHIAEGEVDVASLVTGSVGVDGVAGAFEELGDPERHAKILAEPWR